MPDRWSIAERAKGYIDRAYGTTTGAYEGSQEAEEFRGAIGRGLGTEAQFSGVEPEDEWAYLRYSYDPEALESIRGDRYGTDLISIFQGQEQVANPNWRPPKGKKESFLDKMIESSPINMGLSLFEDATGVETPLNIESQGAPEKDFLTAKLPYWVFEGDGYDFSMSGYANYVTDSANSLLDQAQALKEEGKEDEALALRAQAEQLMGELTDLGPWGKRKKFADVFGIEDTRTTEERAYSELASPQGQIVGRAVQRGRELAERGEAYDEFRGELTAGALEEVDRGTEKAMGQLGASSYGARRALRDMRSSVGGGARQLGAERAAVMEMQERYGGMAASMYADAANAKAQIEAEADRFATQYADQYSLNAAAFAQDWVSGVAGARDQFQQLQLQYQNAFANLTAQAVQFQTDVLQIASAEQQQKRAANFAGQLQAAQAGNEWIHRIVGMGAGGASGGGGKGK